MGEIWRGKGHSVVVKNGEKLQQLIARVASGAHNDVVNAFLNSGIGANQLYIETGKARVVCTIKICG